VEFKTVDYLLCLVIIASVSPGYRTMAPAPIKDGD